MLKPLRSLATRIGNKIAAKPIVAVVEWVDDAREPWMYLANDHDAARRAVVKDLIGLLPTEDWDGELEDIDLEWVQENPAPDLDNPAAVKEWLEALNGDTTDGWVSLFEFGKSASSDTYADAR